MIVGTKACSWKLDRWSHLGKRWRKDGFDTINFMDSRLTAIPIIQGSVTFMDARPWMKFNDGHDDWTIPVQDSFCNEVLAALCSSKGDYTLRSGAVHGLWGLRKNGTVIVLTLPHLIPGSVDWEPCAPYRETLCTFLENHGADTRIKK